MLFSKVLVFFHFVWFFDLITTLFHIGIVFPNLLDFLEFLFSFLFRLVSFAC